MKKNIIIEDIDLSQPLTDNVKYDLVISKFNYELNGASGQIPRVDCVACLRNFEEFQKRHPDIIQIDPLDCQEKLTSRAKMVELFQEVSHHIPDLSVPKSVIISDNESLPSDFAFPVICKTLEASGALTSHDMGIVWGNSGLDEYQRPILVQQLINHNATIFKVFSIGDFYYIVKRPSIRNLTVKDDSKETIRFNSQAFDSLQGTPTEQEPPSEFVDSIVKYLSDNLGLTLIGLDIIKCNTTGKYYIIDANYFPGYTGVDDCPQKFLDLIMKKLKVS